ncbi:hypothetical protein PY365_25485 [Roseiarcaceae bacterium H3SJ34-1]|uniref:hypothetical protein n=1 Tax=Terripilifer ovatus TaxID=3032367 RepID=UPI003AB9758A|nr:hypothetical protein [Roseiarcaceae bacterium H3SJ34-1]
MIRAVIALSVAASVGFFHAARAADLGEQPGRVDPAVVARPVSVVQVTPYLWASGLSGDISPFKLGPTIGVDKSFSDIMKHLNFGGFINLWARYDRFVVSGDLMYVSTTETKVVKGLPLIGALKADLDAREFNTTLLAGYRAFDLPQFTVDFLAGARVWSVANSVKVKAPVILSYSEKFAWIDPVVGVRAFYNFTDKVSALVQADAGGAGVGSKFTWQALATLNYRINDSFSASAGYKVLRVDYHSGGHVFDTTLHGPVIGATYRF